MSVQEPSVVWDLSDLYAGPDDPRLPEDTAGLLDRARRFEEQYQGRIASAELTAETLRAAMDDYEAIRRDGTRPLAYAHLRFSADTSDPARGALLQKVQMESTAISRHLIFLDLEVGRMPDETFRRVVESPLLADYRHYLLHERTVARHHLTEAEEKLAAELSNTGVRAFDRLFSECTARAVYRVELPDGAQELSQSGVLSLLFDPDRGVRAAAAAGFTAGLQGQSHVLTFIFNNLLQHRATMDRLRAYEYPEQSRHEDNELAPEIVRNVVDVAVEGFPAVADYYRLKRRLLRLDELTHVDRYAPISQEQSKIPWNSARELVLDAFGSFSPEMQGMVEPFFSRSWIDADLRPGKRGGAFCSYVAPDVHPYVFMNFTGKPRDVMTLAHELGHALHGILAGTRHHYLNFYPTLPLAETASVFAEMTVFERLQREIADPRERLSLLCGKIEDTIASVFRQVSMYRFEQAAHRARREEGELPAERYHALWQSAMQEMFGDSLILGEEHACWWMYIPHVFTMPFYVYAYSFGELLVLALYARYRQEGEPFVARYREILASGGSMAPAETLAQIGIDISRKEFWAGGVRLIEEMVSSARSLAGEIYPA